MDVTSPQLMWIGKRCYRINPSTESSTVDNKNLNGHSSEYIEEEMYGEDEQDNYVIEATDNNRFRTSFHIPQAFFAYIIGAKGLTRKRIESETKTNVKVPRQGEDGDIVVIGPTRDCVTKARSRIEMISLSARNKQNMTHFLSVPFNHEHIKINFNKFKEEILNNSEIVGIEDNLFQESAKLHITLVILSLMDNYDRANAAQLLQDCQDSIIKPVIEEHGPIELSIIGVDYMNDDPRRIDVLYGNVISEPLQRIANEMEKLFVSKGLKMHKYDNVKLHITLLNSRFPNKNEIPTEKKQDRKTFDGSKIIEKYKDFNFGTINLSEIHLSQRSTYGSDGFYEATGIIKI